jgi:hypothetical protein
MVMLESVLGRGAAPDPAVRIALDGTVRSETPGHVIAAVRMRARRGGVALLSRLGVSLSRRTALVESDVGAVLAVIAIDVDRLGAGTGGMVAFAVNNRTESGQQEKQDAEFRAHGSGLLSFGNLGPNPAPRRSACQVTALRAVIKVGDRIIYPLSTPVIPHPHPSLNTAPALPWLPPEHVFGV